MSTEVVHEVTPIDMVVPTITGSAALVIDDRIADPDIKGVKQATEGHAFDSARLRIKNNTTRPGTISNATIVTSTVIMQETAGPNASINSKRDPTISINKPSKYIFAYKALNLLIYLRLGVLLSFSRQSK